MRAILDFIKEKSYYFLGATLLIIILIIILGSCSNSKSTKSYEDLEENMVSAAKKYYEKRQDKLPNEEDSVVSVSLSTLIENELIKKIYAIEDSSIECSGYVEVTKVGSEYSYVPFLTCPGKYEPESLIKKIINSEKDELGNGVYKESNEYIYKGKEVNNYVKFNDSLWRIVKVDKEESIKILSTRQLEDLVQWDASYNIEFNNNYGITNNYKLSNIRKVLVDYYESSFGAKEKSMIVSKNLCYGRISNKKPYLSSDECSLITEEKEKISLLNISDYKNASLDKNCKYFYDASCTNQNYFSEYYKEYKISTWLLNSNKEKNYKVYYLSEDISSSNAATAKRVNPVVYLSSKVMVTKGDGSYNNPYIIR